MTLLSFKCSSFITVTIPWTTVPTPASPPAVAPPPHSHTSLASQTAPCQSQSILETDPVVASRGTTVCHNGAVYNNLERVMSSKQDMTNRVEDVPISFCTWDGVELGPEPSREAVADVLTGDVSLPLPLSLLPCTCSTATHSLPVSLLLAAASTKTRNESPNVVTAIRVPRSFAGTSPSSFRLELSENSDSAEDTTSPGSNSPGSTGRRGACRELPNLARDGPPSEGGTSTAYGGRDPPPYAPCRG